MVYRRRYVRRNYRRRYNRRRPRYGYFGKFGSHASSGYRLARKALSMLNVEYKDHTLQGTGSAITSSGSILPLNLLIQGDTGSTRDGDSVKFTRLQFNSICVMHASATNTQVRVIIVADHQTNGSQFVLSDILNDSTAGDNLVSPLNLVNKFRFRILFDKLYQMDSNGKRSFSIEYYKKLSSKCRYSGNAGTIADLPTLSYHLILLSSEATNTPAITYTARMRYIDN